MLGLSGIAHSGKSTVAEEICMTYGYDEYCLADPAKKFIVDLFELRDEYAWSWLKDEYTAIANIPTRMNVITTLHKHFKDLSWVNCIKLSRLFMVEISKYIMNVPIWKREMSEELYPSDKFYIVRPRDLIRIFATDIIRNRHDKMFWVNLIPSNQTNPLVISDVRFENEANFIRSHGTLIHVKRDVVVGKVGGHESENEIRVYKDDKVLYNNGTEYELTNNVLELMDEITDEK